MTHFYIERKRVGRELNSGETERERRGERQNVAAKGLRHRQ
jgi:hypothetical protein